MFSSLLYSLFDFNRLKVSLLFILLVLFRISILFINLKNFYFNSSKLPQFVSFSWWMIISVLLFFLINRKNERLFHEVFLALIFQNICSNVIRRIYLMYFWSWCDRAAKVPGWWGCEENPHRAVCTCGIWSPVIPEFPLPPACWRPFLVLRAASWRLIKLKRYLEKKFFIYYPKLFRLIKKIK